MSMTMKKGYCMMAVALLMAACAEDNLQDKSVLNVQDIITFAETVPLDNIRPTVGRQIEKNTANLAEKLDELLQVKG